MTERKSMVDEIREDPKQAPGYYAAELTMNIRALLMKALETRDDLSLEDIAETLGLDVERVRWAYSLNDTDDIPEGMAYHEWTSEGNMYVASLARFLKVLGYELKLSVVATDDKADADYVNAPPKRGNRMRRSRLKD